MENSFKLKKSELGNAIKLFKKGLRLEKPPGSMTTNQISGMLNRYSSIVVRHKGALIGLVSFRINKKGLYLGFICVDKLGMGTGSRLMQEVANYAVKKGIKNIYSEVSLVDKRASGFYNALGFDGYGKEKGGFLRKIKVDAARLGKGDGKEKEGQVHKAVEMAPRARRAPALTLHCPARRRPAL